MHAGVVGPPSGARPRPQPRHVPRPARWLRLSVIAPRAIPPSVGGPWDGPAARYTPAPA